MSTHNKTWKFRVDRGGTFTDIVAETPNGQLITHKLLSENPAQYQDAVLHGIRELLDIAADRPIPPQIIESVRMGTTVATNALLEHNGEPLLLITTQGFRDALRIAWQQRPHLFALDIKLPQMLYAEVCEAQERILADGTVEIPLATDALRAHLQQHYAQGLRAIAIVLMHGYRYPDHEQQIAAIARDIGYTQISASHEVNPQIRYINRGDTTVVDAYLSPVLRHYTQRLTQALPNTELLFMQSNGRLTHAGQFHGKDAILSGPAGGIVGMAKTAEEEGFSRLIGFDMGGTSTDVCHYDGEYQRTSNAIIAGNRISTPMMQIHTVAAGGSSMLHFDGLRFQVGPDSAGSHPGPTCYRKQGPLTITDCNVLLGKLRPAYFPALFGDKADQALDKASVDAAFAALAKITGKSPQASAQGFLTIAVENMANAIKHISVQRGYDVSDHTLCCFGGAGGQHACLVADALGMNTIFIHRFSGVLSAHGMGLAELGNIQRSSLNLPLEDTSQNQIQKAIDNLSKRAASELDHPGDVQTHIRLACRYEGSDALIDLDSNDDFPALRQTFLHKHKQQFGFAEADKRIIVDSLEVEISTQNPTPQNDLQPDPTDTEHTTAPKQHPVFFTDQWLDTPFWQRESLSPGDMLDGPAVVIESTGTVVLEPGWRLTVSSANNLILKRISDKNNESAIETAQADPIQLEIFNNLFMNIAEQMGSVLEQTAVSVNIKERLDFSCAIFNPAGDLVANAPHMPVHLGSMSETIKSIIREHGVSMQDGDAFVSNNPYNGGTHLPDITVVLPLFRDNKAIFYVAARGHHADIGGITPGSIPPDSNTIDQEGILIDNQYLLRDGQLQEKALRQLLADNPHPSRKIDFNIADLKAQLAACYKGAAELESMLKHYGYRVVAAYMQHVQDNAEESVRRVISRLRDGEFRYEMDDGTLICVSIRVDPAQRNATIDFTGTSAEHPGNFNAPIAITKAAVLYVFRCLVVDDIPLNEGCLKPLKLIIPDGSILKPRHPRAVVAGNVETSQAVVNCLFGALGTMAAAQGTMNNITWGNENYQYYETLCGGAGATPNAAGADAVHTHMTNSRLTDPEILEQRFPVVLEAFSIRQGSGGKGRHRGGHGIIRKTRFLEDMTVSLVTGHRSIPPYGLQHGASGKTGSNRLLKSNGDRVKLDSVDRIEVSRGDILEIKTPGGGGYTRNRDE